MVESFTANYMLCSDGSARAVFHQRSDAHALNGKHTLQDNGKKILLAGGFSALTPEAPFPLSVTLQLNGDLGNFSPAKLEEISNAELTRHHGLNFRSYALETDTRLAVLSSNPEQLNSFMEIYGGVLELAPILLKGWKDGITTADELQIESIKNGFQIHFTVKSPVDKNRCTYCGACGPICPEQCLSETLFLDFSRCTYCKECVNACPHEAIDLYGVEKRTLEVPALLLLDGARGIELPEQKKNIYSPDNIEAYFSSLFPCQVEEVVTCDNSICQYSGRHGTGCDICFSTCQHGAVTRDSEGITIDPMLCRECGACISSCPTGSIQYQRFSDLQFIEYFRTFRPDPATIIVLGSEKAMHRFWWRHLGQRFDHVFFLEYPNIKALSAMHLAYLFSAGAGRIVLLDTDNPGADHHPLAGQIRQTNQIIHSLFDVENFVVTALPAELKNILDKPARQVLKDFNLNTGFENRRVKLTSTLQFLTEQSGRTASFTGDDFNTFGQLDCDADRCTQCLACLNDCRMEALRGDDVLYSLNHKASRCVQCAICVDICPENALTLSPGLHLEKNFFTDVQLSQGTPIHCKECGKIFGTRKSFERVMARLTAKNMPPGPDNLFEYCDKCRVIKLFESSEATHEQ